MTASILHHKIFLINLSFSQWDLLLRDYNEAKEYIEDIRDICDDFEGLCQRNLAANTGMSSKLNEYSLISIQFPVQLNIPCFSL